MATSDILNSMKTHIEDAYNTLETLGGSIPENKNLENLATCIDSLFTPLEKFKKALDNGTAESLYPPNTLIADKYDGKDFNWVVGQYGNSILKGEDVVEGCYLFADRALGESPYWTSNTFNVPVEDYVPIYAVSPARTYLLETILPKLSDRTRSILASVQYPCYNLVTKGIYYTEGDQLFLLNSNNILGYNRNATWVSALPAPVIYQPWDAWKARTGLDTPSSARNTGRIMSYEDEAVQWALSAGSESVVVTGTSVTDAGVDFVYASGSAGSGSDLGVSMTSLHGIVPACFIAKK